MGILFIIFIFFIIKIKTYNKYAFFLENFKSILKMKQIKAAALE